MPKIKDLSKSERPREKLIFKGPENLKDEELLAILLGTGIKGKNVIEIAKQILRKHSKKRLLKLDYKELSEIKGVGSAKACTILAAQELVKRALDVEDNNLPTINNAKDAVAQLQKLRNAKKEHFVVLYLNARNQLIHEETISIGTLNANLVHPREVFYPAIEHLAASIIVAHNHPSGDVEASEEDLDLTRRIKRAGDIIGIEVIQHIIISNNNYKIIE